MFIAVIAVLLCAVSLFLLGGVLAAETIWGAWRDVAGGRSESTDLTVRFLAIVSVMLKAVFFYLIGVGLYSLFIAPLNVTVALGVETLNDLETKVISVIIVIMAVRFLERFSEGEGTVELVYSAVALGVVTAALVFFKIFTHREGQAQKHLVQEDAKREMFERAHERHEVGERAVEARAADAARPR
ncbi:MAG TPA: YqhA family protein [Burkholderiales bacterium]|nr:YqhA family protein [Burkholderiales bacterium]